VAQNITYFGFDKERVRPVIPVGRTASGELIIPDADPATGAIPVQDIPLSPILTAYEDYSISNLSESWTQIVASTSADIRRLHIFDSSGKMILLGFGAAGDEEEKFTIAPGGDGVVNMLIPSGTRLSIKSMSGTIVDGELLINFLG
jgi:hypothetical protein